MSQHCHIFADRHFLRLSGPDTLEFLRGLVTQSLESLSPERARYALLLTPQGKIIADFFLTTSGEDIVLETDAAVGPALQKKLTLYKLRAKVEITDETEQWSSAAVWHGEDDNHGEPPGTVFDYGPDGLTVYADPRLAALGTRVRAPSASLPGVLERMNAKPAGAEAWQAHRLTLGAPLFGEDFVSEQIFPMDANMDVLNAVDYKKGCFVGQEVASRMKRKGEVRKRMLMIEGDALSAGAEIKAGETTLGTVTSCAGRHGLALIRLDRLDKAEADPAIDGASVSITRPAYLD